MVFITIRPKAVGPGSISATSVAEARTEMRLRSARDANEQTCVLLCIPCSARQAAGAFLELDADHFEIGTRGCGPSSQAVHLAAGTSATVILDYCPEHSQRARSD